MIHLLSLVPDFVFIEIYFASPIDIPSQTLLVDLYLFHALVEMSVDEDADLNCLLFVNLME